MQHETVWVIFISLVIILILAYFLEMRQHDLKYLKRKNEWLITCLEAKSAMVDDLYDEAAHVKTLIGETESVNTPLGRLLLYAANNGDCDPVELKRLKALVLKHNKAKK
ncbi:MAG: hypothetical protein E6Q68_06235 [Polynucleobacter sp.]|nr:MAG: hypothetical protein E6Q68_06235 [Polynucleobacter sp.]